MRGLDSLTKKIARFEQAEIPVRAAALAYHTILAIVPLLGLFFWYLKHLGVTDRWLQLSKTYIVAQLNVASSSQFNLFFEKLTHNVQGSGWGWIGLLLFIYTSTNLIVRFGQSLDRILGTAEGPPDTHWSVLKLAFRRLVVMLGLPIAVTLSLGITQWMRKDSWLHFIFDLKTVGPLIAYAIPVAVDILVLFFVYHFIPKKPVPWREALRAAVIVAPVAEAVHFCFSLYNNYAVNVHRLYGVLAVIPLFILWVQITWMIVLSGALFIKFRKSKTAKGTASIL